MALAQQIIKGCGIGTVGMVDGQMADEHIYYMECILFIEENDIYIQLISFVCVYKMVLENMLSMV